MLYPLLSLRELKPTPRRVEWAMNLSCHGEERSDVAIHLKFLLDRHALLRRARDDKQGTQI